MVLLYRILYFLLAFRAASFAIIIGIPDDIIFGGEPYPVWYYKTAARYYGAFGFDLLLMLLALVAIRKLRDVRVKLVSSAIACVVFYSITLFFTDYFP
jgi:hypothetical protein